MDGLIFCLHLLKKKIFGKDFPISQIETWKLYFHFIFGMKFDSILFFGFIVPSLLITNMAFPKKQHVFVSARPVRSCDHPIRPIRPLWWWWCVFSENPTEGPNFLFHPWGGFVGRRTQVFFCESGFFAENWILGVALKKLWPQNIFQKFWLKSDLFWNTWNSCLCCFCLFPWWDGISTIFEFLMRANNKSFEEAEIP